MVGHYQKCDFLELSVTTESFRYFVDYASCFLLNCSSTMGKHLSPSILLEAIAFDVNILAAKKSYKSSAIRLNHIYSETFGWQ